MFQLSTGLLLFVTATTCYPYPKIIYDDVSPLQPENNLHYSRYAASEEAAEAHHQIEARQHDLLEEQFHGHHHHQIQEHHEVPIDYYVSDQK